MSNNIDGFYEQISKLKEFIQRLLEERGKSTELLNDAYSKLLFLKKANKKGVIEVFYAKYVCTYYEMIINKNEEFFVNKVKDEIDDDNHLGIFSEIHTIWNDLNPETKKAIWKYIHVICILSERINDGSVMINRLDELKNNK